jgi:hypothetical protein
MKSWSEILNIRTMPDVGDTRQALGPSVGGLGGACETVDTDDVGRADGTPVIHVNSSGAFEHTHTREAETIASEWLTGLGGGTARIVPSGTGLARGKTYSRWLSEQRDRG